MVVGATSDDLRAIRRELTRVEQVARQLADVVANQAAHIAELADGLRAVNAKTQRASATITGPFAIGNTDVTITWDQPWPDTAYGVVATIISGTAALGSLDATLKVGTKTVNDCVVTVANTGLASVGTFALDVVGVRA